MQETDDAEALLDQLEERQSGTIRGEALKRCVPRLGITDPAANPGRVLSGLPSL